MRHAGKRKVTSVRRLTSHLGLAVDPIQRSSNRILAEPWSSDDRFSLVDYRDVAETAAIALRDDRLLYGTFELCAPEYWNRKRVARLMSEVLGREIKERRELDALSEVPQAERRMFDHYDRHDLLGNPLTLEAILNREPRTLRAYFEERANNSSYRDV